MTVMRAYAGWLLRERGPYPGRMLDEGVTLADLLRPLTSDSKTSDMRWFLDECLGREGSLAIVATDIEENILGWGALHQLQVMPFRPWVGDVFVAPDHRGHDTGRAIVRRMLFECPGTHLAVDDCTYFKHAFPWKPTVTFCTRDLLGIPTGKTSKSIPTPFEKEHS